jgi:RNA polymerase-binding transcription factor DksA
MSSTSALPERSAPLVEELAHYREQLTQQWRSQVDEITRLSIETLDADDREGHNGAGAEVHQVASLLLAAARHQAQESEAALRRIDDGSYGLCGQCSAPIPADRLDVLPAARYCVSCQSRRSGI